MAERTPSGIQGVPEVKACPSEGASSGGLRAGSVWPVRPPRTLSIDAPSPHRTARLRGQALEVLGHAIEYLVDSRLVQLDQETTIADGDAVRLLMGASREVFAESSTYLPVTSRLRRWLYDKMMALAA